MQLILNYGDVIRRVGIGKYTKKYEFYRKCTTRWVKDTSMNEIGDISCVKSVMTVTPVLKKRRDKWDENRIITIFDNVV